MISIGYGKAGVGESCGYYGGTELGAERLTGWLKNNGVDVDVVAAGSLQKEYDVYMGSWFLWGPVWFICALYSSYVAFKNRPDVIYSRFATYPLFVGVLLKFIYSKPLIVSVHGGDMRKSFVLDTFIEFLMAHTNVVVCYDNDAHIKKIKDRNIDPVVIPNGVEIDKFVPSKKNTKVKKVIYLGGKRKIKGYSDMLKLAKCENLWRKDILELHMYGVGKEKSNGGVFYHKYVDRDKLPNIMTKGDLFILPSYAEGVPGALLEAMACGMYVVCSDLDYTRKVIDFSYLFKPGDVEKMVYFIDMYESSERGLFHNQSAENVKFIKSRYSMDIVGEKWLAVLKKVSGV